MLFKVINLQKLTYSSGKIKEENITGEVEITADKTYRNYVVLRPLEWLIEKNEENRKRKLSEWSGLFALKMRYIIELTKKESEKAFSMGLGEILEIKRDFIGIKKNYRLKKYKTTSDENIFN